MVARSSPDTRTALLLGAAGPVLMGAVLGLPAGVSQMLTESLLLPAVVAGLSVLMVPALYISLSLAGVAPPAREVAGAAGTALQALGLVLAGLAPAAAFLLATTQARWAPPLFGVAAVATAALFGLRQLFGQLREHAPPTGRLAAIYLLWAAIGLGLGAHFFLTTLDA